MASASSSARYNSLLHSVGKALLKEGGYSLRHLQHSTSSEVREIVQHLLVVRPPPDDSTDKRDEEHLYSQVDELLALEKRREPVVDTDSLLPITEDTMSTLHKLSLWKGDITTLNATAIVNAANSALLGCFQPTHKCIDNVIHCKAGPRLRAACGDIMTRQGFDEPVGAAKITPGFALPSKYVIHTVGPQLRQGASPTPRDCKALQSCYTSSLDLLLKQTESTKNPVSIAFPCISTGLFAFPIEKAVPLAVSAVVDWLEAHASDTEAWKVIFNTFSDRDFELYKAHLERQEAGVVIPAPPMDPAFKVALDMVKNADYLLIAGAAGLSAAAGLDYTSPEVMKKLHPTARKALPKIHTLYHSIGYSDWSPSVMWGFLFKHISIARFGWAQHRTAPTYARLRAIHDRFERRLPGSTFIKTSNADGMFEQEGFPTDSLYIMQGSYGRIQCKRPCRKDSIFDSKPFMEKALQSFNPDTYEIEDPAGIPKCPNCGGPMFLHLRVDGSFLQSALDGMKRVYQKWLAGVLERVEKDGKKLVILEIGVGFNTPTVIRLPDERIATMDGVSLVRINEQHPEMPLDSHGVSVRADANGILDFLAQHLEDDDASA